MQRQYSLPTHQTVKVNDIPTQQWFDKKVEANQNHLYSVWLASNAINSARI